MAARLSMQLKLEREPAAPACMAAFERPAGLPRAFRRPPFLSRSGYAPTTHIRAGGCCHRPWASRSMRAAAIAHL